MIQNRATGVELLPRQGNLADGCASGQRFKEILSGPVLGCWREIDHDLAKTEPVKQNT